MPKTSTQNQTNEKPVDQEIKEIQETHLEVIEPAEIKNDKIIFTPKHLELIKNQIAKDASPEEYDLFIMMARRTRLDPLLKQLYFIKYKGKDGRPDQVNYVTSIDSYRIIAHRTNMFAGIDEPLYRYDKNGGLTHCTVTVYRFIQGQRCAFTATVKFAEYNTGKNQWASKPETMIAKVAEAHALRKAFPQDLSGIYTTDEMEQAENKKPISIPQVTEYQLGKIDLLIKTKELNRELVIQWLNKQFKVSDFTKLSLQHANKVVSVLESRPDPKKFDPEQGEVPSEEIPDSTPAEEVNIDEIDAGISKHKNDAKPGAQSEETIS